MSNKLQNYVRNRLAEMGRNPFEVARDNGFERNFINEIVTGKKNSVRSAAMPKLAAALGVSLDTFMRETIEEPASNVVSIQRPTSPGPTVADDEIEMSDRPFPYRDDMPRNLPVYGTAAGSPIGTFEGFNLEMSDPIDYVRRPPALRHVKNAYAITVTGTSMYPAHSDGDLRFVNPNRHVKPGDTVILQTRNGEHDWLRCFIKNYVKTLPDGVRVEQFNPKDTMDFKKENILAIHYVMTMNDLFGL